MLIRMLAGQAPRFYAADKGAAGAAGQAPAAASSGTTGQAEGQAEGQAGDGQAEGDDLAEAEGDAGQAPSDAEGQAEGDAAQGDDAGDDDDDDAAELSTAEWRAEATKARDQAARYRVQRNQARAKIAELEQQLAAAGQGQGQAPDPVAVAEQRAASSDRRALIAESASEAGVPAGVLGAIRDLNAADGAEQIAAALGKLKSHLAPAGPGGPRPPAEQGAVQTLDDQIREAAEKGDTGLAIRLKAAKLAAIKP